MTVTADHLAAVIREGDPHTTDSDLAEHILTWFELTPRPAAPGPLCGAHYAGDLICGQPAGHAVIVTDPDTWHRHAAVKWC